MAGIPKSPNLIQTVTDLEFPGGPIPLNSRFYIDRSPAEARACAEIGKPGSLIRIKAPRKMGKSSLMLRIIHAAVDRRYRTVTVDFQQADEAVFATLDKFLRWLCVNVARQLKLEPNLDEFWDEDMGSKVAALFTLRTICSNKLTVPLSWYSTKSTEYLNAPISLKNFCHCSVFGTNKRDRAKLGKNSASS